MKLRSAQAVFALGLVPLFSVPLLADPPALFSETPVLVAKNPARFQRLWRSANERIVRAIVIGDSQETCPESHGRVYMPRLHAELAARFGPVPETPWMEFVSSAGSGNPWAECLVRSWWPNANVTPSTWPTAMFPPGTRAAKSCSLTVPNINSNQTTGQVIVLQPRGESVDPGAEFANLTGDLFYTTGGVFVEVLALSSTEDVGISLAIRHLTTPEPSLDEPIVEAVSGLSLLGAAPGLPIVQRFGPFTVPTGSWLEIEIAGTRAEAYTHFVAARFVSAASTHGWSLTDLAAGGYTASRWASEIPGYGPIISALAPDMAIIMLGANDVGSGINASAYRQHLESLISGLRASTQADLPVLLIADPPRLGIGGNLQALQDRYAGACAEIALADESVAALNSRRLLDDQGWTFANGSAFTPDTVHYNALGARMKAALELETLYTVWQGSMPPCWPDLGSQGGLPIPDGQLDNNDFVAFIDLFFANHLAADLGRQGGLAGADRMLDNNDFVAFVDLYFVGCP